jgi:hypothetical protein
MPAFLTTAAAQIEHATRRLQGSDLQDASSPANVTMLVAGFGDRPKKHYLIYRPRRTSHSACGTCYSTTDSGTDFSS